MRRRRLTCKVFVFLTLGLALFSWPEEVLAQQPTANSESATVIVEWITASELNLAGFNLYRSVHREGPYVRVNDALLPASPDPVTGGSYAYTDTTVTGGVAYFYKLEDLALDGSSTMHGPIEIMAQADVVSRRFGAGNILATALLVGLLAGAALVVAASRAGGSAPSLSSSRPGRGGSGPSCDFW